MFLSRFDGTLFPVHTRRRVWLAVLLVLTIAAGVASRKAFAPAPPGMKELGGVLWAVMFYALVALVRPAWRPWAVAAVALPIAWATESLQLVRTPWLDAMREWPVLGMLLGRGFSWLDMSMYVLGVAVAVAIDTGMNRSRAAL